MEEIYEKIMREGYGLQLRHGTRTRTGLVCRTDKGLCELKKPRGSTDSLRLAFDVKKRLRENGFANISRCYPTLEGEPFYRQDGTLYILEDVLPQGTLAEDSAQTFLQGAETLGEMHAAAKGLASEAAHWEKNRLPQLYAKRRSELAKVRRRNDKRGSYDAIDLLLLQYYEPYMERAAEAEELLCRGGYAEAIARTAQEGGFCHNAYKGEALRQETDGRIFVGNFDKCSAELPLADLAAYIRRYFKKTEGTAAGISAMLERYGRHCPLSERDMILLQGMLLYPEKFLRLINEYYNRRRTCVSPAMRERLAAAAKEELNGVRLKSIIAGGCWENTLSRNQDFDLSGQKNKPMSSGGKALKLPVFLKWAKPPLRILLGKLFVSRTLPL